MDFQSANFGVNTSGMTQYIEEINSIVLNTVAPVIQDTTMVKQAVDQGWIGQSAETFKNNLDKAAKERVEELNKLKDIFEKELTAIQSKILAFDANLVEEGD